VYAVTAFSLRVLTETVMHSGDFLKPGPQRQVFVAGVEEIATLVEVKTQTSEMKML
jgi:hypothetical protein